MGLFKHNYTKEGPGVQKDEPRKKGISRFFQVLSRVGWDIFKANLLFFLCAIPFAGAFLLAYQDVIGVFSFMLPLIASLPLGGAFVALVFCVTKAMRDEPGFVWHDFKRKFIENAKQAAIPGALYAALFCGNAVMLAMFSVNLPIIDPAATAALTAALIIANILFALIMPYVLLHIAYVDMSLPRILISSIILSFAKIGRSFMGALSSGAVYILFIWFLPGSLHFAPLLILFGVPLSWLMCLFWIWPPMDSRYSIEKTLRSAKESDSQ